MVYVFNFIRESVIFVVFKGIFFICFYYFSYFFSNCSISFLFFTSVVVSTFRIEIVVVVLVKRAYLRRFLFFNSVVIKFEVKLSFALMVSMAVIFAIVGIFIVMLLRLIK